MGNLTKLTKVLLGATALTAFSAVSAHADGTAAGTNVQNTFTLDYQVGGVDQPTIDTGPTGSDEPTEFTVDRLVDLTVATNGDTTVAPGAQDQELVFSVTNTGNATQGYTFALLNEAGDDFDTTGLNITYYFDDGTAGFGPGDVAGTAYTYTPGSGLASEDIPADATIWVVVDGDISGTATDTNTSAISLVADTVEDGNVGVAGVPVTADATNTLTGMEDVLADEQGTASSLDAVLDGAHSATGNFVVASADLTASKTVSVFSQDGSNCATIPGTASGGFAVPGTCVEYVISATNNGASAVATDINIADELPTSLIFVAALDSTFTGGTLTTPAANAVCDPTFDNDTVTTADDGVTCDVELTGASLAAGATGTVTIRALVR